MQYPIIENSSPTLHSSRPILVLHGFGTKWMHSYEKKHTRPGKDLAFSIINKESRALLHLDQQRPVYLGH